MPVITQLFSQLLFCVCDLQPFDVQRRNSSSQPCQISTNMHQLQLHPAHPRAQAQIQPPQGYKCIVYHFLPLLWLLYYPDLACNQRRLPIKRKSPRRLSSFGPSSCLQVVRNLCVYGSDLCLRMGDDSSWFGRHGGKPGFHVPKCHCGSFISRLHGNQNPNPACVSAAGRLEPHRQENCTR